MPQSRRRSLATSRRHLAEETATLAATAAELGALHAAIERFWAYVDQIAPQTLDLAGRLALTTAREFDRFL